MLNRWVLSRDRKTATEGAEVTRSGRLFQTRAAATAVKLHLIVIFIIHVSVDCERPMFIMTRREISNAQVIVRKRGIISYVTAMPPRDSCCLETTKASVRGNWPVCLSLIVWVVIAAVKTSTDRWPPPHTHTHHRIDVHHWTTANNHTFLILLSITNYLWLMYEWLWKYPCLTTLSLPLPLNDALLVLDTVHLCQCVCI